MTRGLTDKQEKILSFIMEYVNDKGYPPSIREIGNHFSISSLRGVTVHLDALERKQYIKRANTARAITVIGRTGSTAPERNASFVPLVGQIAAGFPMLAQSNIEGSIPVSHDLVGNVNNAFALRVKGESMIDAHIMSGDVVIIKPQTEAVNGDLVAALVHGDDGEYEATIKRIQFTAEGFRLIPANPLFEPRDYKRGDCQIAGKVIGLVRDLHKSVAK